MQPRREAECALHLVCALFSKNSMVGVNIPLYYGYHNTRHRSDYIFQGIYQFFLLKSLL